MDYENIAINKDFRNILKKLNANLVYKTTRGGLWFIDIKNNILAISLRRYSDVSYRITAGEFIYNVRKEIYEKISNNLQFEISFHPSELFIITDWLLKNVLDVKTPPPGYLYENNIPTTEFLNKPLAGYHWTDLGYKTEAVAQAKNKQFREKFYASLR